MTAGTHLVFSLSSLALIEACAGASPPLVALPLVALGSLAPDIDNQGAIVRLGRWTAPFIGNTAATAVEAPFLRASSLIRSALGHRGLLHSPLFCVLLYVLGSAFLGACGGWLAWGYATHLAADACTVSGVPAFAPFGWQRQSLLPIRTGGRGELVFAAAAVTASVATLLAARCA